MQRMMSNGGLEVFATDDPEITSHPANCLMARIGKNITVDQMEAFDDIRFMNRFFLRGGCDMPNHSQQETGYVYSDALLRYRFHNKHPFNQMRVKLTTELLLSTGYLSESQIITPRQATIDEIAMVHKYDYIQAVMRGEKIYSLLMNNKIRLR